jgi:hypothetical protein
MSIREATFRGQSRQEFLKAVDFFQGKGLEVGNEFRGERRMVRLG